MIGGWGDYKELNIAVQFTGDGSWMSVGELMTFRHGHRSIVHDQQIIHVGGDDERLLY